jgi:hypothetical protein
VYVVSEEEDKEEEEEGKKKRSEKAFRFVSRLFFYISRRPVTH